jgi:hypothetical protein
MNLQANLQLIIIGTLVVFCWLTIKLVRYLKRQKINSELWCTIFEGLTQGALRLDHLKNPGTVIEKKMRRDGKDKDPLDLDRLVDLEAGEYLPQQTDEWNQHHAGSRISDNLS